MSGRSKHKAKRSKKVDAAQKTPLPAIVARSVSGDSLAESGKYIILLRLNARRQNYQSICPSWIPRRWQ